MAKQLTIHTCGTARNNPGSAGIGLVIETPKNGQILISENIGIASTQQAQYQAVIMALLWTIEHKYDKVNIYLDNAKMIRSLLHNPTVTDLDTLGLHKRARRLARSINTTFSLYDGFEPHKVMTLALEASLRESPDKPEAKTSDDSSREDEQAPYAPLPSKNPSTERLSSQVTDNGGQPAPSAQTKSSADAGGTDSTPATSSGQHSSTGQLKDRHAIQQSAGGVVYRGKGDKLQVCLIAKKNGTLWALPKGRIRSGETWEAAAVREVLEETGHLATIAERIDQIEYYFYWRDNRTLYYKLVTFFLMPVIQENVSLPDGEASAVAWFDINDAWQKLYYQSEKSILQQAKRSLRAANII
ncbi:MAG: NUDIX domain-containing protein [bacterium]|nr:NUDIX domain-containing protein [bacterium]